MLKGTNGGRLRCVAGTALILLAVPVTAAGAEGADLAAMRQELERLRQQLQSLEALKDRIEVLEDRLAEQERAAPVTPVREAPAEGDAEGKKDTLHVGGALRFNYFWKGYDEGTETRRGDLGLDLFRLNVDGELDAYQISAEYRHYPYMDTIHHGWFGYRPSENEQFQLGVTKVPFGILPYAAHSYWFGLPYYLGLADDYDAGLKYRREQGPWDASLAFFKNDELGNGADLDRISYDPAAVGAARNEETNTLNARLAYTFGLGSDCTREVGASAQWGELYNRDTDATGDRYAGAVHLDSLCGRWNGQLELGRYRMVPENPPGVGDETVTLGGFGGSYPVAAEGSFAVANVAYNVPVSWPRVQLLTCYNDFSMLRKDTDAFDDSYLNTTGCVVKMGPTYTYVDLIHGRNAIFLGDGSLAGGGSAEWERRLNVNIGYYW